MHKILSPASLASAGETKLNDDDEWIVFDAGSTMARRMGAFVRGRAAGFNFISLEAFIKFA